MPGLLARRRVLRRWKGGIKNAESLRDRLQTAMPDKAPDYPGYGNPCNGCGQCCLDQPCPVSRQYKLWQDGKCKALSFKNGRYWCDVLSNPSRISLHIRKISYKHRLDAIGVNGKCDAKK